MDLLGLCCNFGIATNQITMTNVQEIWKAVIGFIGYEVSNMGRVRSMARKFQPQSYILKCNKTPKGYIAVALSHGNKETRRLVHRLVLSAFKGDEKSLQVNHIDGNKSNNNLSNLEWVTQSQNIIHAYATGLMVKKGDTAANRKLNSSLVAEIRAKFSPKKYTRKMLSLEYGVSESTIHAIILKRNWKC